MFLNKRTNYLKYTMGFAAFGFLFNMTTVLMLYLGSLQIARLIFAGCCVCMIISIFLFMHEIRLSNQALEISFERYGLDEKRLLIFIF